jgi:hypothetical protein
MLDFEVVPGETAADALATKHQLACWVRPMQVKRLLALTLSMQRNVSRAGATVTNSRMLMLV